MSNTEAPTSIERLHALFCVDEQSGVLVRKVTASSNAKAGSRVGSVNSRGYLTVRVDGKSMKVHRIVFALVHGRFPEFVDHVDGDKLNNHPANLREATKAQNSHNVGRPSTNKSGIKGVSWSNWSRKWKAQIQYQKGNFHLGLFPKIEDAAEAVRNARAKLHGEFARHD